MIEAILLFFWVIIAALATVGAVKLYEWYRDGDDLAERERRAEQEIQNITYQAQMAMLNEAMRRTRADYQPPVDPNVIEGNVIWPDDNRPS